MVEGILVILGVYGISIALVHLAWFYQHRPKTAHLSNVRKPIRYVLICCNHEHVIEWYLRSFLLYAWVKGDSIHLSVMDRGSTDNTPRMLERLAANGSITVIDEHTLETDPTLKQNAVVIELNQQGEIGNIQFMRPS